MGKKKKKNVQKPNSNNNNNNKSNKSNNNDSILPSSSPLTNTTYFILLSLGGYMNATNYNILLDDIEDIVTTNSDDNNHDNDNANDISQLHNDDEMDDILNAMDIYEEERKSFSSSIVSLARSILFDMNHNHTNKHNNNDNDNNHNHDSTNYGNEFDNIEKSISTLYTKMESYTQSIHKQRQLIHQCQQQMNPHPHQHHQQHQHQPHQTQTQIKNNSKNKTYKSKFTSFIQRYKHQLYWETIVIAKLDDLLCNECLYSYNNNININNSYSNIDDNDDSDNDNHGDNHGYNDKNDTSRTLSIYQDLISWSKAIEHCSLLSSCTNGNGNTNGNDSTNTNTNTNSNDGSDRGNNMKINWNTIKKLLFDDIIELYKDIYRHTTNENTNENEIENEIDNKNDNIQVENVVESSNVNDFISTIMKKNKRKKNSHVDNSNICTKSSTSPSSPSPTSPSPSTSPTTTTTTTICQKKMNHQNMLQNVETIEQAVNIFLNQNVLPVYNHAVITDTYTSSNSSNSSISSSNEIKNDHSHTHTHTPNFVLLVGPSNSGKTYFCNMVQNSIRMNVNSSGTCTLHDEVIVIYPTLPSDFLGSTVGSFEDSLLSLFTFAIQQITTTSTSTSTSTNGGDGGTNNGNNNEKKCIVLLDGMEHILGMDYAENDISSKGRSDTGKGGKNKSGKDSSRPSTTSSSSSSIDESNEKIRVRSLFLSILDKMKTGQYSYLDQNNSKMSNLLVICTARSRGDGCSDRFDKHYYLGNPDWEERCRIIKECLGLSSFLSQPHDDNTTIVNDMLSTAATSSMGKSRGEIALYCREAMNIDPSSYRMDDKNDKSATSIIRLELMQASLQNVTPESLKQLSCDDSIEMRVLSSKELQSYLTVDDEGNVVFPLFGTNVLDAWRQLQNIIITPLCQWEELDKILFGKVMKKDGTSKNPKKAITSGVLLTGSPGVGKTAIAYHCAAVAARMEPTTRLLDVSCTSLVSKEVGGSEKSISRLFRTARSAAPCIILLDGIENIAQVRGNDNTTEGTMDRLLSTLLTEMDGVMSESESDNCSGKGIAIIGITHNPPEWIDPALRRPGRLEKCIDLGFPDSCARKEILSREIIDLDIDFTDVGYFDPKDKNELCDVITTQTSGKSAAELIAISKNARMLALRDALGGKELVVRFHHFTQAVK